MAMTLGPLIIVSGPSGSGKSTIIERLLAEAPRPMHLSVSATTRSPRAGEQDGVHYHYWSRERFDREVAAGAFLEWAEVFGNCYGTLKKEVDPYRAQGIGVLLDVDVQGAMQVRRLRDDAIALFIRPPSLAVLEQRLRARRTETEAALQRRLKGAEAELALADQYDYQIVNDNLDSALAQVHAIVDPLFERQTQNG